MRRGASRPDALNDPRDRRMPATVVAAGATFDPTPGPAVLAKAPGVGHMGSDGDVAEWLKAAVC